MDMDSSRRSFDRSRELGVKKPRLGDEIDRDRNLNTRGYPQQRPAAAAAAAAAAGGTGLLGSRFRASERDDPSRGGGAYTPQPLHSELVSQYKTALAELTFNSKPIITNLTIIAGESLHAAKAIAATICSNIIEVPSDQKLPSLYLLDSIVKNIGRDYIKYFAARLPEVFCKAYRQVESSMHSGMRHLFGTWKGVFPPQCLQMIEKELGFSSTVNGTSSAVTASKSNSQSQRQPHSIHVNPKYLEARQRLQTNRAKGLTNELTGSLDDPNEDVDRLERTAGNSTSRTWTDLPVKAHNIHRSLKEAGGDPVLEKNDVAAYGDHEYSSDLSRAPGLGIGRGSERASNLGQDKSRYTARSGVAEALNSQKNGFDIKNKFPGYLGHRSTSTDLHPQTTQSIGSQSGITSRSWKNSEEEEYIWDDMNPRLKDHGVPRSSRKDRWTPDNSEKMEFENIPRKPQRLNDVVSKVEVHASSEQKERALFGHQTSSPWSNQESNSVDGLDPLLCSAIISAPLEESNIVLNGLPTSACSLNRTGFRLQTMPSHSGNIGQWPNSRGSASPSGRSPVHQKPLFSASHPPQLYHTLAEQDQSEVQSMSRPDSKAVQVSGQLNRGLHRQNNINHDITTMPQNTLRGNLLKVQSQNMNTPSNSLPLSSFQSMNPKPYSSQMHVESAQPKPSLPKKKPPLPQISNFSSQPTVGNASPDHSKSFTSGSPAQSNPSSLLAALMKSGILSNNKPSVDDTNSAQLQSANQLSLLSGPLSAQFTSSGPMVASTPLLGSHSDDDSSNSSNSLKRKAECSSLPLALPASSSPTVGPPTQISSQESNTANPISNLLSSLVAKGLISSSKTESQSIVPPLMSTTPENQNADITTSSPVPVASAPISSVPVSLTTFASSSKEKGSLLEPDAKRAAVISESTTGEIENLIGFGFKPDVIRESHPSVISFLFDDFPYQCNSCGIQLRIKEQHDRHLEWHTFIEHEPDRSRKWYLHSSDWIARGIDSGFNLVAGPCKEVEHEQMVPADESQCLCILCGELFEDFYCQEKDEWMFKGAMYMSVPPRCDETATAKETAAQGPIVHQKCISESSVYDLGLANSIKMEEDK